MTMFTGIDGIYMNCDHIYGMICELLFDLY